MVVLGNNFICPRTLNGCVGRVIIVPHILNLVKLKFIYNTWLLLHNIAAYFVIAFCPLFKEPTCYLPGLSTLTDKKLLFLTLIGVMPIKIKMKIAITNFNQCYVTVIQQGLHKHNQIVTNICHT
jgi:hypothetical protein